MPIKFHEEIHVSLSFHTYLPMCRFLYRRICKLNISLDLKGLVTWYAASTNWLNNLLVRHMNSSPIGLLCLNEMYSPRN